MQNTSVNTHKSYIWLYECGDMCVMYKNKISVAKEAKIKLKFVLQFSGKILERKEELINC